MSTDPLLPVITKFDQTLTFAVPSGGEIVIKTPSLWRDTQVDYQAGKRQFFLQPGYAMTMYYVFRGVDGREYGLRVRHRLFDALPEISMNGRLIAVPPPMPRHIYVLGMIGGIPAVLGFFSFLITPLTMISTILSFILLPYLLGISRRYSDPSRGIVLPILMIGVSWGVWLAILIGTWMGYLPTFPDP